jgi:hypothetical protein
MIQKPDFQSMSIEELRKYVLEHREDDTAFYELSDRIKQHGKPLNIDELPEILERKRQAS